MTHERAYQLTLQYATAQKTALNAVVTVIANSFHPLVSSAPYIPSHWTYTTYVNYGPTSAFALAVPQAFAEEPPPLDHDGRAWVDGSASINAVSDVNVLDATLSSYVKGFGVHLSTETQGSDWVAVSWTTHDTLNYNKAIITCGNVYSLTIQYPRADQQNFNAIVAHVENSFRPVACSG